MGQKQDSAGSSDTVFGQSAASINQDYEKNEIRMLSKEKREIQEEIKLKKDRKRNCRKKGTLNGKVSGSRKKHN